MHSAFCRVALEYFYLHSMMKWLSTCCFLGVNYLLTFSPLITFFLPPPSSFPLGFLYHSSTKVSRVRFIFSPGVHISPNIRVDLPFPVLFSAHCVSMKAFSPRAAFRIGLRIEHGRSGDKILIFHLLTHALWRRFSLVWAMSAKGGYFCGMIP